MYTVLEFGHMASDGVRMHAYATAIARTVKPGSVVVDIGAGTGIFSLLAARAGARRVHAVDLDPAIWVLPDLARENGVADRITIHHQSSLELSIPERADVIVSDLRGSIPLYEAHLESLRDARTRLLAPGGTLLPKQDRLMVGVVEQERLWSELERGWRGFEDRGLAAAAARTAILNYPYNDDGRPVATNQVLTDAKAWAELAYGEDYPRVYDRTVELTAQRDGTAHALALWFEATILDGITYASAPGSSMVYKRMLLPLLAPVRVTAGEAVKVTVRMDVTGERWAWDTAIGGQRFRQSTFLGKPTSPEALLREASTYVPNVSARGERAKRALELMDGKRSVQEIAAELGGTPAILDEVRDYVRRYGR
jgi:protein arginine N-methyltransferase 1